MARKPRLFVEGYPYHIVQRGNNKSDIFFADRDYLFFLNVLREAKAKHRCLIFGYCLMTNHVHLFLSPTEQGSISSFMKFVGGKYAFFVNKVYQRTGTLWEGRYKSALVQGEPYFLRCVRYIDNNPVRAGIVSSPELYCWSSYRYRAYGEANPLLDCDPWYEAIGSNPQERQDAYRKLFVNETATAEDELIRIMTKKGGVVGIRGQIKQI